jgi:TolB protein
MNEDGTQDLRQLLEQQADRAPQPSGLWPITVRRARAHRFGLAAVTCVALVAVVVTGIRITTAVTEQDGKPGVIRIPPAKHKHTAAPSDQIAFTRYGGEGAIYVLNTDGGIRKVISEGPYAIAGPAWSPNGTKIAFHGFFGKASMANNGEGGGLFVINADGSHLKLLRLNGADPAWAPDGKRIAFYAENGFIYVTGADGHGFRVLTDKVQGDLPTWSPDGTRIAFVSPPGAIYVVRSDGSHLHRIAGGHGLHLDNPAWSPNGIKIAFTRYGKQTRGDIYMMNPDGSSNALLVANGAQPAWSPDGRQIAFVRVRHRHGHIFSIGTGGAGLVQLTHGTGDDSYPAWRP